MIWGSRQGEGQNGGLEIPMGLIGKIFDSPSLVEKLEGLNAVLT